MHNLTRRSTRGTVNVSVTKVPTVQELHDPLQIGVAQPGAGFCGAERGNRHLRR